MKNCYKIEKEKLIVNTHVGNIVFKNLGKFNFKNGLQGKYTEDLKSKGVYCFVENDTILYVGKTDISLKSRLNGYVKPGIHQATNKRIKDKLSNKKINLYFLPEKDINQYADIQNNDEISINRCIEIIVTGYCWNKNLLNK